jgi:hypothetical protein
VELPFDKYTYRARLLPSLLTFLPLAFATTVWFPDRKRLRRSWGCYLFHQVWRHCLLTLAETSVSTKRLSYFTFGAEFQQPCCCPIDFRNSM